MKGVKDAYELEQISNESSRGTRKPAEYSPFFSVVSFFSFRKHASLSRFALLLPLTVAANELLFHAFASLTFKRTVYDERRPF